MAECVSGRRVYLNIYESQASIFFLSSALHKQLNNKNKNNKDYIVKIDQNKRKKGYNVNSFIYLCTLLSDI